MDTVLIVLAGLGLCITIGNFLDKYYHLSPLATRVRSAFASAYRFVETRTSFGEIWAIAKDNAVLLGISLLVLAVCSASAWFQGLAFQWNWLWVVSSLDVMIIALIAFPYAIISLLLLVYAIVRATIIVGQLVSMHVLHKASDPTISPFGYTFGILGVFLALIMFGIQLGKYLQAP